MRYFIQLLPFIPVTLLTAGIFYFAVYMVAKDRRIRPSKKYMLAEFLLINWAVLFLFITQVMSFGNGLGEETINLIILEPFRIAFRYGSNNAGMLSQIFLNTLMIVPLGFLLPIVFPKKFSGFLPIFLVSFAVTIITELSQLLTGRSADIDDIIANTMGGVIGFAMYVIFYGIFIKRTKKPRVELKYYGRKLSVSLLAMLVFLVPFITIMIMDTRSEFGKIYYGHIQPKDYEINSDISDEEASAAVYRYLETETVSELQSRLIDATGFSGTFKNRNLSDGGNKRIFIYDYNTWGVLYNY